MKYARILIGTCGYILTMLCKFFELCTEKTKTAKPPNLIFRFMRLYTTKMLGNSYYIVSYFKKNFKIFHILRVVFQKHKRLDHKYRWRGEYIILMVDRIETDPINATYIIYVMFLVVLKFENWSNDLNVTYFSKLFS